MEIVTAIVTPVVESLMVPIKKHLGYLISCTRYLRKMDTRKRELDAKMVNVQNHMDHNRSNNFQVPAEVSVWLQEVEEIEAKVKQIPDDVGSCLNLKVRHRFGRTAFKITEEINGLIERSSSIDWTEHPIPLAKVGSMKASTSTTSTLDDEFKSREETLMKALKALQPDHKSHMLALCGMGGVGKTTMMQKIKNIVGEKKMFDYIVEAAIGEKTDPIAIQQAVAEFLGTDLKETTKEARAAKLRKSFEAKSDGGKKKIIVILDDVWQFVDMNDIGLSSLPNQGVDFKVLLTSRNREVCIQMGVEVDSIITVEVLTDSEAQTFLYQIARSSDDANLDLDIHKIGEKIANKCQGLPIAIKTIAHALKGKKKHVWENALSRLKHHDNVVHQIFEISYNNLHDEETRSTLLLCILFPEDFDIPKEDLVRYGWGLKLYSKVYTIREARNKLNAYIEQLVDANLLIQSQVVGCIKMHDLVRAFVLDKCSKGEQASVVSNMSTWSTESTSKSCKRISLTCQGVCEFPRGFECPNLSLLKLMHEGKSLEFPADFYGNIEKLQVVVYENIRYPLLPRSLECSTNLRTLCLHRCSLMFDLSFIGNLLNLEVLTFVECGIRKLPSSIGNLKRLKLLDVTDCVKLCIDDGVLKSLVALEELYMRAAFGEGIRFTRANKDELVECAKNLLALEIEFFDSNVFPNNISFEKLERFKISLGCYINEKDSSKKYSFDNALMLVTNKSELLEPRVNVLFDKTEVLRLEVDDIDYLGDGLVDTLLHQKPLFFNLRLLHICECANMKYLFTVHVAHGLPKLERLVISQCDVLETMIHGENNGVEVIKFQVLKFLSLKELPNLMSLCNVINVVVELPQLEKLTLDELPNFNTIYPDTESTTSSMSNDVSAMQPVLNKKIVISKLKTLEIRNMEKLKEIWPSDLVNSEDVGFSTLRRITVEGCDSLVNLLPCNPMSLLRRLEHIEVRICGSIDVLFNMDSRCVGERVEGNSNLRHIIAWDLGKLREVWRVNGIYNSSLPILGFEAVEYISIRRCTSLRNVFTPTSMDFDLRAIKEIEINGIDGWGPWRENKSNHEMVKGSQEEEIHVISNKDALEMEDSIPSVAFPSYLIHTFNHLHTLIVSHYNGVEIVFDLEGRKLASTQSNQQPLLLPYIKDLRISYMERMTHVWKYNRNALLVSGEGSKSSFHNLTDIRLDRCKHIKYLFSPMMAKLLSNLKNVFILNCDAMEEVVSSSDDKDEEINTSISSDKNTTFFPHLDVLWLRYLPSLKHIDGVGVKCGDNKLTSNITTTSVHDKVQCNQVDVAYWSLCQYSKKIVIDGCDTLSSVIPSHVEGQQLKLEMMSVYRCKSMLQIFEVNNDVGQNTSVGDGSGDTSSVVTMLRSPYMTLLELPNLKELQIGDCCRLENIFTCSTLESLKKLEELYIWNCVAIQVIVTEENEEQSIASKDVVFPRLKYISLNALPCLKAFFLGNNDFQWPLLDKVEIYNCPQMMTFTSGNSSAPKLNYIHTKLGKHSLECGLNFDWTSVAQKV